MTLSNNLYSIVYSFKTNVLGDFEKNKINTSLDILFINYLYYKYYKLLNLS